MCERFEAAGKAACLVEMPVEADDSFCAQAIFVHLHDLTEPHEKAAKLVNSIRGENALTVAPDVPEVRSSDPGSP